ncbi:MAG: DNA adenine methylase [Alistipes sp.]|nr:DNA adenine methylase [Alistipes sp.]
MPNDNPVSPFVKWVGGKRRLIGSIMEALPPDAGELNYAEPFIGGGAVLFHLRPANAVINDFNPELINVYRVIRDNVEELIADLRRHRNESDYFYNIRRLDRTEEFARKGVVERASRFIFLNKTCYNGLYRVNNAGEFNTPFGRYKSPNIVNEKVLRGVSSYLNENNVRICNCDYEEVLRALDANSFVYLDPPYHPISPSSSFTGYIRGGWDEAEQTRLRDACDELTRRGIRFLLSNSSCGFIRDLYDNYDIRVVRAARPINSVADRRGEIDEVLIRNYV